jgi:RNA polymerase sigma factor (sigma-70 family)
MAFPLTRLTLIQRLVSGGSEEDWSVFLAEYWGPVCRFALRFGAHGVQDAEDVASHTFEIILSNQLLGRWTANRSAKLRSLLCSVVRNVLSNRHRVAAGRERLQPGLLEHIRRQNEERNERSDEFYAAWVEDLLQRAMDSLAAEYHAAGKGDCVRVLYGRICRQRTVAEVAESLGISPRTADNYFRDARERLQLLLEEMLRTQLRRYCAPEDERDEFAREWQELGQFLVDQGGLDAAIQRACELLDPAKTMHRGSAAYHHAKQRISSLLKGGATASAPEPSAE